KQFRCPSCQKPFLVGGSGGAPAGRDGARAAAGPGGGRAAAPVAPPPPTPSRPAVPPPLPPTPSATTTTTTGARADTSAPAECPACKAKLLPGAIACMDCGYLIQAEAAGAEEGAPNLCPNPACGVANPPGERNCQRCSTPLPAPP